LAKEKDKIRSFPKQVNSLRIGAWVLRRFLGRQHWVACCFETKASWHWLVDSNVGCYGFINKLHSKNKWNRIGS